MNNYYLTEMRDIVQKFRKEHLLELEAHKYAKTAKDVLTRYLDQYPALANGCAYSYPINKIRFSYDENLNLIQINTSLSSPKIWGNMVEFRNDDKEFITIEPSNCNPAKGILTDDDPTLVNEKELNQLTQFLTQIADFGFIIKYHSDSRKIYPIFFMS